MADTKISDLTELAEMPAADDLIVAVDISDTSMAGSGTDKKVKWKNAAGNTIHQLLHQMYGGL